MGDIGPWPRGKTVVVRHVWRERVWFAHPATVVEDHPQRLVLFEPAGAIRQWSHFHFDTGVIDPPISMPRHSTDALILLEPGAAHAVSLFWRGGDGEFLCWYVDLQAPFHRVRDGIVTWDQQLDMVVGPNRKWRWKDEDHIKASLALGWMSPGEAAAVRGEGESVVAKIEKGEAPFDNTWINWRPDPSWPIPILPPDWDEHRVSQPR